MERKKLEILLTAFLVVTCYFLVGFTFARFVVLLIFLFGGIFYFKYNPLHPFVWLSLILVLYNCSIYILDFSGIVDLPQYDIIQNSAFLSILTLYVYCGFFVREPTKIVFQTHIDEKSMKKLRYLLIIISIFMFYHLILFQSTNYSSKMEMNLNGGVGILGLLSKWFFVIYTYYIVCFMISKKHFPFFVFGLLSILTLAISLIIGERDILLTILVCSFFVYRFFNYIKLKKLILLSISGLIIVSVLGDLRQITRQDGIHFTIMESSFAESVVSSEFGASGSNFELLLENRNQWKYKHGESLVNDIIRSIFPPSVYPAEHTTLWYNKQFNGRLMDGYGMGFSYLAEGYLQGGYLGVIIWILLLIIIVHLIYNFSFRTPFGLATYVYMICIVMYSMRGDFSYILSPLIKQVMLIYIVLFFILGLKNNKSLKVSY